MFRTLSEDAKRQMVEKNVLQIEENRTFLDRHLQNKEVREAIERKYSKEEITQVLAKKIEKTPSIT